MRPSFDDSFSEIKTRIKRQMQNEKINDYLTGLLKSAYERAFADEKIVLSKPEREVLWKSVTREILADMLEQFKP